MTEKQALRDVVAIRDAVGQWYGAGSLAAEAPEALDRLVARLTRYARTVEACHLRVAAVMEQRDALRARLAEWERSDSGPAA